MSSDSAVSFGSKKFTFILQTWQCSVFIFGANDWGVSASLLTACLDALISFTFYFFLYFLGFEKY